MSTTLAPSRVTHRDPKGLKFMSIVETAYDKAGLSDDEAQRVNDTPGLADLVANFLAENRLTDKFKDEEVKSTWTYPPEYKGPKPLLDQLKWFEANLALNIKPALDFAEYQLPKMTLPEGAEGWFAVPTVEAIVAQHFPKIKNLAEQYCAVI